MMKGFPFGGSCLRSGLMRGDLAAIARLRGAMEHPPLIRPCGATFPLGERQENYRTGVPLRRLRLQWQWAIAMPRASAVSSGLGMVSRWSIMRVIS